MKKSLFEEKSLWNLFFTTLDRDRRSPAADSVLKTKLKYECHITYSVIHMSNDVTTVILKDSSSCVIVYIYIYIYEYCIFFYHSINPFTFDFFTLNFFISPIRLRLRVLYCTFEKVSGQVKLGNFIGCSQCTMVQWCSLRCSMTTL